MAGHENEAHWKTRFVQPRLPWITHPVLPADLGNELCASMLNRDNMLEDVHYQKVVPNRFVVEVGADNYVRNYHPLEGRVVQQWQVKLAECLATANSRLGRKEYVLAGRVAIEIRPANDLKSFQARISCSIQSEQKVRSEDRQPSAPRPAVQGVPGAKPVAVPAAPVQEPLPVVEPMAGCLEELSNGRRWTLYPGVMTLGRLDTCDVFLAAPEIQERRLISGLHAFLQCEGGRVRLFDGSPNGRPSLNGTYVNGQRIYATGVELHDGDMVTLAATDPNRPNPMAPGVVSFRFIDDCRKSRA